MAITARSIGGAGLMGLGDALQAYAQQGIRRRSVADQWQFELAKQALAEQNKRQDAATAAGIKREDAATAARQGLISNILAHPENAAGFVKAAGFDPAMQGVPLDQFQGLADTVGSRQIISSLNQAPSTGAMGADLGQRFTDVTGQDYGSLPLQPAFDLQRFGGEQPDRAIAPTLQTALSTALARNAQLQQAERDKVDLARQMKGAEKTGELEATHEGAPTALADKAAAETALGPIQGTNAGLVAAAQYDAAHTPERVTAAVNEAARKAGATAAATKAAEAPYQTPMMLYDESGAPTPVRFALDAQGKPVASVVPGLPAGLTKTAPRKLGATEVDKVSSLNNAEVETVKVLKLLHDTGLDKSKSLSDPRWRSFMMTSLQMAPDDLRKGDITQRTQAVQAILLRQLMGGRPSQYVAEIIKPHLPDANMTGELLAHNLKNVMEQVGQYRAEIEHLAGQQPGKLSPTSGMTYQQYLDSLQQAQAAPVTKGSTLNDLLKQ
jgi:hypothetical protein